MEILPLFPSNLVVNNLDSKFNTIDIKNINFNNSGKSGQSAEQSSSLCVINDYQELGIEIIKIFQDYSYNILKLNNNFTISTSWFTRMKPDHTCAMHQHHNSFYSGLYYFDDYEDEGIVSFMNSASTWTDAEDVANYFDEPASDLGRLIASYYQEESGYKNKPDQWDNYLDNLFHQTEREGE